MRDKTKASYTPFPPPQEASKIDKQIESGEYFLAKEAKKRAAREERTQIQRTKQAARLKEREAAFMPPKEDTEKKRKRKGKHEEGEKEGDDFIQVQ